MTHFVRHVLLSYGCSYQPFPTSVKTSFPVRAVVRMPMFSGPGMLLSIPIELDSWLLPLRTTSCRSSLSENFELLPPTM